MGPRHESVPVGEFGLDPEWGVSRCACGVLHLKLGALQLELNEAQFKRLQHLLRLADRHFGLSVGAPQPAAGAHGSH